MRRVMLMVVGFFGGGLMVLILCTIVIHTVQAGQGDPMTFPHDIQRTTIRILELRSFDGRFYEDGSCRPVSNVSAIIIRNTGEELVRWGAVKLWQGKRELVFTFTMIPPGGMVLVQESGAKSYQQEQVTGCWGWAITGASDGRLQVEEMGRTSLAFTNLSERTVDSAVVWFKNYDSEENLLIGGISYRVEICQLKPGGRMVLPVFQYVSGNSVVVGCT